MVAWLFGFSLLFKTWMVGPNPKFCYQLENLASKNFNSLVFNKPSKDPTLYTKTSNIAGLKQFHSESPDLYLKIYANNKRWLCTERKCVCFVLYLEWIHANRNDWKTSSILIWHNLYANKWHLIFFFSRSWDVLHLLFFFYWQKYLALVFCLSVVNWELNHKTIH